MIEDNLFYAMLIIFVRNISGNKEKNNKLVETFFSILYVNWLFVYFPACLLSED
jgi:hypothetical protein